MRAEAQRADLIPFVIATLRRLADLLEAWLRSMSPPR
jgi:hypothetical protein